VRFAPAQALDAQCLGDADLQNDGDGYRGRRSRPPAADLRSGLRDPPAPSCRTRPGHRQRRQLFQRPRRFYPGPARGQTSSPASRTSCTTTLADGLGQLAAAGWLIGGLRVEGQDRSARRGCTRRQALVLVNSGRGDRGRGGDARPRAIDDQRRRALRHPARARAGGGLSCSRLQSAVARVVIDTFGGHPDVERGILAGTLNESPGLTDCQVFGARQPRMRRRGGHAFDGVPGRRCRR